MKQIVAYYWGLLWHNLEIELMRVGEPIIGVVEKIHGVASFILTFQGHKKSKLLISDTRAYTLYSTLHQRLTAPYTISTGISRE